MKPTPKKRTPITLPMPHAEHERAHGGLVIGVDEVGRGPLAGPVVAAAVWLPESLYAAGFQDSKLLKAEKRAALHALILSEARYGVGEASVAEIDEINILHASMLAMTRAVHALCSALDRAPDLALIDGNRAPLNLPCAAKPIVKGDTISVSIAAASIIAKVTRDLHMAQLHEAFPHYGWHSNAGYGTAAHYAGLTSHGICEHHRRSFAPVRALLEPETEVAA